MVLADEATDLLLKEIVCSSAVRSVSAATYAAERASAAKILQSKFMIARLVGEARKDYRAETLALPTTKEVRTLYLSTQSWGYIMSAM